MSHKHTCQIEIKWSQVSWKNLEWVSVSSNKILLGQICIECANFLITPKHDYYVVNKTSEPDQTQKKNIPEAPGMV